MADAKSSRPIVGAIIQARLGSSRLPRKVMAPIAGQPLLAHVIERLRRCRRLDRIVIATSTAPDDCELLAFAEAHGVDAFAGSEEDVLERFRGAAAVFGLDIIVRICSDSPLIDWVFIDRMVEDLIARQADYTICDESIRHACEGFEAVTTAALDRVAATTSARSDHEHVTMYIRKHAADFQVIYQPVPDELRGEFRMSVDVAADLELMRELYGALYRPGEPVDLREAVRWLRAHPAVLALNAHVRQKPAEAVTRHVVLALGAAYPPNALALARRLAESHHCVITIISPWPASEMREFVARGYRLFSPDQTLNLQPRLVLFDDQATAASWLPCTGVRCLPLSAAWEDIVAMVERD